MGNFLNYRSSKVEESVGGLDTNVFSKVGRSLYLSEKAADVYLIFESGERIPAHKPLLVAASEVFDTMFFGSMPEKGDVKMVDVSADAFKEFLQFFYFNKVPLTIQNIGHVMYLGDKYDVAECMKLCETFL